MGGLRTPSVNQTTNWTALSTTALAFATPVTNGAKRRLVRVLVSLTATVTAKAFVGFSTVINGTTVTITDAVGIAAGLAGTMQFQLCFEVDPNASYQITSDLGAGASGSVIATQAIDL